MEKIMRGLILGFACVLFSSAAPAAEQGGNAPRTGRLLWIDSPNGRLALYNRIKAQLRKDGWETAGCSGMAGAEKADLSKADLICIETFRNNLSKDFYLRKLAPAVKNGAVLVLRCYHGIEKLHYYFRNYDFEVVFREDVNKKRRPSWVTSSSFVRVPRKLDLENWQTPPGIFIPDELEGWDVLARQFNAAGDKEYPFIMARPWGRGMVVMTGAIRPDNMAPFLLNAYEYRKVVKREKSEK